MNIYLQARGSYDTLLDLSKWCENNDIKRIGLPDHYIVGKQRANKDDAAPALDLLTAADGLLEPFDPAMRNRDTVSQAS